MLRRSIYYFTISISIGFLALTSIQVWKSLFLCVPLGVDNYFTVDNSSGFWAFRIGDVGGVDGFELYLKSTHPRLREFRSPFDLLWNPWEFEVQGRSPYFILMAPALAPALLFGAWPLARFFSRLLRTPRRLDVPEE